MVNSQDNKHLASSNQTVLGEFIQPIPSPNRAFNTAAKPKSSGRGNPITPGYARNESFSSGESISSRMKLNKGYRHEVS
jgi:hypothetical protein